MPLHSTDLSSISLLNSRLCLDLPISVFPSRFPTKTRYVFLTFCICAISPKLLILLGFIKAKYQARVQIMNFLIMQFSPVSCYFLFLGPNIFRSTLFTNTLSLNASLCERSSFTSTHNDWNKRGNARVNVIMRRILESIVTVE